MKKTFPDESVGVICKVQDQYQVVEYSEISVQTAEKKKTDGSGELLFDAANICNHFFTLNFLQDVCQYVFRTIKSIRFDEFPFRCRNHEHDLIYHIAKKKIPSVGNDGKRIDKPLQINGIKLEKFVFDVFACAKYRAKIHFTRVVLHSTAFLWCLGTFLSGKFDVMKNFLRWRTAQELKIHRLLVVEIWCFNMSAGYKLLELFFQPMQENRSFCKNISVLSSVFKRWTTFRADKLHEQDSNSVNAVVEISPLISYAGEVSLSVEQSTKGLFSSVIELRIYQRSNLEISSDVGNEIDDISFYLNFNIFYSFAK